MRRECVPLASLAESRRSDSLAEMFFFATSLGACSQARKQAVLAKKVSYSVLVKLKKTTEPVSQGMLLIV